MFFFVMQLDLSFEYPLLSVNHWGNLLSCVSNPVSFLICKQTPVINHVSFVLLSNTYYSWHPGCHQNANCNNLYVCNREIAYEKEDILRQQNEEASGKQDGVERRLDLEGTCPSELQWGAQVTQCSHFQTCQNWWVIFYICL